MEGFRVLTRHRAGEERVPVPNTESDTGPHTESDTGPTQSCLQAPLSRKLQDSDMTLPRSFPFTGQ